MQIRVNPNTQEGKLSRDSLWNEISNIVKNAEDQPSEQEVNRIRILSALMRKSPNSVPVISSEQIAKLAENKNFDKKKACRKIVLHYSFNRFDEGDWVKTACKLFNFKVKDSNLTKGEVKLNDPEHAMVDVIFHNLSELEDLPKVYDNYERILDNCQVYLIIDDQSAGLPKKFQVYNRHIVKNLGDLTWRKF